jgi:hypothetical protein
MTAISSLGATANTFSFTLHTSSGDTVSLSMYDEKSLSFSHKEEAGVRTSTMSLRHEFGYRFHYEGNGIDARDRKEIEEAMKTIRPMFRQFLENVQKSDEMPGLEEVTNITQLLKGGLPEPKDENTRNYLKDRAVDEMDGILRLFKESRKILESAKAFFDRLFDESRKLDLFA